MTVEVLVTFALEEPLANALRGVSPRLRVTVLPARSPDEIPVEVWGRAEVLYTSSILPTPEQAPALRWIQFQYAGIDRWLEHPVCQRPGLMLTNLSGAGVAQMGEYVLMMLLALGHRLPALGAHQRKAEWPKDRWKRFEPLELRGSTVGIIGYGSIGREVARLLQAFGATVLAAKWDAMDPRDSGYTPEGLGDPNGDCVHRLYPPQALRSMLHACDFVVITAPLTPATRQMVNAQMLTAMRPGAYLVNVARGQVMDYQALTRALQDGRLGGAALDVFPEEPLPPGSPLWNLPNVIITPHIADSSAHFNRRALELFSENLHRYLANLPLYNLYDPQKGY